MRQTPHTHLYQTYTQ